MGQDMKTLSGGGRDRYRAEHIGVIFQQFNLLPFATVQDNILLPLRFAPRRNATVQDPAARASELCVALGLPGGVLSKKAGTLSVGQQQRVAVARALIGAPPVIIADEPTSALDETSRDAFLDLMFEQARAQGATLLMVSHDPRLGARFDRVAEMRDVVTVDGAAA